MTNLPEDLAETPIMLIGPDSGVDEFIAQAKLLGCKIQFVKAADLVDMTLAEKTIDELDWNVNMFPLSAQKTLDELIQSARELTQEIKKLGKELAKEDRVKPEKTHFKTARNRVICNRRYC